MSGDNDHFRAAMPIVAQAILGAPNKALSTKREARYGKNGSLAVHLDRGTWRDHQNDQGGGVLAFIEAHKGLKGRDAIDYMRSLGCDIPDDSRPRSNGKANGAAPKARAPRQDDEPPPFDEAEPRQPAKRRLVATYDYVDADGKLLYQVCRFEPKTFRQRRKARPGDDPEKIDRDGWVWNLDGISHGLYRFDQIAEEQCEKPDERRTLFLPEGEKDVHTLESLGLFASTNSGGAKNWSEAHAAALDGFDVVLLVDNDKAGRERIEKVAPSLAKRARSLRVLDLAASWPDMPEKGDVTDWVGAGHTKKQLLEIVAKLPAWEPEPYASKFGAIPMSRLWEQGEPYRWLIKGVLPENETALVFGEPQSGKSFLALDMAMAIARGVDFMGKKVPGPKAVVYCAFEGGKGFRNRVQGYFLGHELARDPTIPFVLLTRRADLFGSEDTIAGLIAEIEHWKTTFPVPLGLVVFDTISAATPGMNENAGEEVSRFIGNIHRICSEVGGATGLLVHHVPKGGGTPRGSGKLTGDLETTISVGFKMADVKEGIVARDAMGRELREVRITKQREGERGTLSPFSLPSVEIRRDADGDPVTTCYVQPAGGFGRTDDAPAEMKNKLYDEHGRIVLKPDTLTLVRALREAIKEKGRSPNRAIDGAANECVTLTDWRIALQPIIAEENEEPEKLENRARARIQRAIERFIRHDVIGKDGDWVWRGAKLVAGLDRPPKREPPKPAAPPVDAPPELNSFL